MKRSTIKITKSGDQVWDVSTAADEAIGRIAWEPEREQYILMPDGDCPPLGEVDLRKIQQFMWRQRAEKVRYVEIQKQGI